MPRGGPPKFGDDRNPVAEEREEAADSPSMEVEKVVVGVGVARVENGGGGGRPTFPPPKTIEGGGPKYAPPKASDGRGPQPPAVRASAL